MSTWAAEPLELTYLEYELLAHLVAHPLRVHTRSQLLQLVWGWPAISSRTVDTHIARLRGKLGDLRQSIETVHRVGYRYRPLRSPGASLTSRTDGNGGMSAQPELLPRRRSSDPSALVTSFAGDQALWRPLVRFDPAQRVHTRLDSGPGWEAWLLTWLPGQGTLIHDHGGSAGAFVVVDGSLTEETYGLRRLVTPSVRELRVGRVRAFSAASRAPGDEHRHDADDERARLRAGHCAR